MRFVRNKAGAMLTVCALVALAETAAGAGGSMGCSDRPFPATQQLRTRSASDGRPAGRLDFHRPAWVERQLPRLGRSPSVSRNPFDPPTAGVGRQEPRARVESRAGSLHFPQPEWVERLYAKYPLQPETAEPAVRDWAGVAYRPSHTGGLGR